jgi:hypothetical protein
MDSVRPGLSRRLVELEAEARYARERYQLYRAKAYGPRSTSAGRLRDLERQSKMADRLLDRAKADQRSIGTAGLGHEHAAATRSTLRAD